MGKQIEPSATLLQHLYALDNPVIYDDINEAYFKYKEQIGWAIDAIDTETLRKFNMGSYQSNIIRKRLFCILLVNEEKDYGLSEELKNTLSGIVLVWLKKLYRKAYNKIKNLESVDLDDILCMTFELTKNATDFDVERYFIALLSFAFDLNIFDFNGTDQAKEMTLMISNGVSRNGNNEPMQFDITKDEIREYKKKIKYRFDDYYSTVECYSEYIKVYFMYDLSALHLFWELEKPSTKDVENLICIYHSMVEDDPEIENTLDLNQFLRGGMNIIGMCKAYNKAKEYFSKNCDEVYRDKWYEVQAELSCERTQHEEAIGKLEYDNRILKEQNEEYELRVQTLVKENKRLLKELEEKEKEEKELFQLRNYVSQIDGELAATSEETSENMEELIRSKRIVIIGGHDNWLGKLQNIFDDWIFISPNQMNFSTNILLHADYIFFFTSYLNHGMYQKAMQVISAHKIVYSYLSSINVEQSIKNIYEFVISNERKETM